jgi:hypothetical protein
MTNKGSGYVDRPHISVPAPSRPFVTGSPYTQNCSSITGPFSGNGSIVSEMVPLPYSLEEYDIDEDGAGGGCRIDGAVCAPGSPLRSFVADSFTQVNQGGPGHLVINMGYAQFVSCFTTFCSYSFKSVDGGQCNISTSVTDFGRYALVAAGYWEEPITTGSVSVTQWSGVSAITLTDEGSGYVAAPTVVFQDATLDTSVTVAQGLLEGIAGRVGSTTAAFPGAGATANAGGFRRAATLLTVNVAFLKAEVMAWVSANVPSLTTPQRTACERDVGYIVDAIVADLLVGGFMASMEAASKYYDGATSVLTPGTQTPTANAIMYLRSIVDDVIRSVAVASPASIATCVAARTTFSCSGVSGRRGGRQGPP